MADKSEVPFRVAVLKNFKVGADGVSSVTDSKSVCLDYFITLCKNKGGTAGYDYLSLTTGASIFLSLISK